MTARTRRLVAVALAVPLVVGTAGNALAGTKWTQRSSGSFVSTQWVEMGEIPGVAGTVHVGWLEARGDRVIDVFGEVVDWTCPDGVQPPAGGGHGDPEPTECTLESQRFVFGAPGAVTLTVDRKLSSARLVGTLEVSDHDGQSSARPPVDVTFTGVGTVATSTSYGSYTDGSGVKYTTRSTETAREGRAAGRIGAMVFDDEPGEASQSRFGTFKTSDRTTQP